MILLHCFGPVNTRGDKAVKRGPGKVPGGLVPCVARITMNGLGRLKMFKGSCSAPSKANIESCVRMISLTGKRMGTLGGVRSGSKLDVCGLNAKGNCDILSVIGGFRTTANIGVPCIVGPHHPNSVTAYCSSTSGTRERLK